MNNNRVSAILKSDSQGPYLILFSLEQLLACTFLIMFNTTLDTLSCCNAPEHAKMFGMSSKGLKASFSSVIVHVLPMSGQEHV
jgi:hypothetical protein